MPELPELEALSLFLDTHVRDRRVESCLLASFAALKTYDPPLRDLVGARLAGCRRTGKHLDLQAPPLHLVIHLARAGWVRWADRVDPAARPAPRGPVAMRLVLDSGAGLTVTEQGTEKKLAIHLVRSLDDVPGIASLGIDPLGPDLDDAALAGLLRSEGTRPLKSLLTDQHLLAGIGNAYSDEVLHAARLSPFRRSGSLSPDETAALRRAMASVLSEAVERASGLAARELKADKRSGMRVHGRTGQPCPVCGDTVREVSLADRSFQYCPTCQTGGRVLADRRLSRLLR